MWWLSALITGTIIGLSTQLIYRWHLRRKKRRQIQMSQLLLQAQMANRRPSFSEFYNET